MLLLNLQTARKLFPKKYVDRFVMPVSRDDLSAYKEFAEKMAIIAKRHGALQYVNCIAEDVTPGEETSFPQAVKLGRT